MKKKVQSTWLETLSDVAILPECRPNIFKEDWVIRDWMRLSPGYTTIEI